MKNFTLKSLATLALLLIAFSLKAQADQTIDLGDPTVFNYTVDIDPANGGQSPDGTPGSTYAWTVTAADAILTVTGGNTNKASIDWSAVDVGTYFVQVLETNLTCPSTLVEFEVEIVLPDSPVLAWGDTQPICPGDDATFDITNAPAGAVIAYTATGGTPATGTATADSSGNAQIVITHDGTSPQIVVNLVSMVVGGNTVTFTPVISDTADVNIVQTSPIELVP